MCLFTLLITSKGYGQQNPVIDSLEAELRATKNDTSIIKTHVLLAKQWSKLDDDKAQLYYQKSMKLAKQYNPEGKKVAEVADAIGVYYAARNKLDSSIKYFALGYEIAEKGEYNNKLTIGSSLAYSYLLQDKLQEATPMFNKIRKQAEEQNDSLALLSIYSRLGGLERKKNNYEKAIFFYQKGLAIAEAKKTGEEIGRIYYNLGNVFRDMKQYELALEHHTKSLPYFVKENLEMGVSYVYNAIGNHYVTVDFQPEKALDYYEKALIINKKLNNESLIASQYNNIGVVYEKQKLFDKSLEFTLKAQEIKEGYATDIVLAQAYYNTGNVYRKMKNYSNASEYANKSLEKAEKTKDLYSLQQAYYLLSQINEETNNMTLAHTNFKKSVKFRDSLNTIRNSDDLARIQTLYELSEKEKEINSLNQEKKLQNLELAKNQAEISKEKTLRNAMIGGLSLVVLLLFFVYKNFRTKKKANELLESKNEIIEEQNQKIVQSINYAKKIQGAILAEDEEVKAVFPGSFVYYKPRDIVSGDFYCFHKKDGVSVVALVDCTGHGVPGGFMSMIGFMLFNETVREKGITDPAEILEALDAGVFKTLKQGKDKVRSDDGMDMAVCTYNENTGEIVFAGAMSQMFLMENNKLKVIEGNIRSVGGSFRRMSKRVKFTNQVITPIKGSKVYLTTDGYIDQFGGPNNKKFNAKRFRDLLANVATIPITKQEEKFDEELSSWRGENRQIDDICVIGFEI